MALNLTQLKARFKAEGKDPKKRGKRSGHEYYTEMTDMGVPMGVAVQQLQQWEDEEQDLGEGFAEPVSQADLLSYWEQGDTTYEDSDIIKPDAEKIEKFKQLPKDREKDRGNAFEDFVPEDVTKKEEEKKVVPPTEIVPVSKTTGDSVNQDAKNLLLQGATLDSATAGMTVAQRQKFLQSLTQTEILLATQARTRSAQMAALGTRLPSMTFGTGTPLGEWNPLVQDVVRSRLLPAAATAYSMYAGTQGPGTGRLPWEDWVSQGQNLLSMGRQPFINLANSLTSSLRGDAGDNFKEYFKELGTTEAWNQAKEIAREFVGSGFNPATRGYAMGVGGAFDQAFDRWRAGPPTTTARGLDIPRWSDPNAPFEFLQDVAQYNTAPGTINFGEQPLWNRPTMASRRRASEAHY